MDLGNTSTLPSRRPRRRETTRGERAALPHVTKPPTRFFARLIDRAWCWRCRAPCRQPKCQPGDQHTPHPRQDPGVPTLRASRSRNRPRLAGFRLRESFLLQSVVSPLLETRPITAPDPTFATRQRPARPFGSRSGFRECNRLTVHPYAEHRHLEFLTSAPWRRRAAASCFAAAVFPPSRAPPFPFQTSRTQARARLELNHHLQ